MIDSATIITRLKAEAGASFKQIGSLIELAEMKEPQRHQLPAIFVFPLGEEGGDFRAMTGAVDQPVESSFGFVLVGVNSTTDQAAAAQRIETLRKAVKDVLFGWTAPGASRPFAFGGGSLLGATPATWKWQDTYFAPTRWRA